MAHFLELFQLKTDTVGLTSNARYRRCIGIQVELLFFRMPYHFFVNLLYLGNVSGPTEQFFYFTGYRNFNSNYNHSLYSQSSFITHTVMTKFSFNLEIERS